MIPRVIHQIWLGSPLPAVFRAWVASWTAHHPDWDHVLWTDTEAATVNGELIDRAAEFVPAASIGQFQADLLRYELLERYGGVYVDTDFECRRPVTALLTDDLECFAAWEEQDRWVNNAIMGAIPGAPFLKRVIAALPLSVVEHRGKRPNVSTGPQLVTRLYRDAPRGLTVFPQRWFYPYSHRDGDRSSEDYPEAYAVHHWANRNGLAR